MLEELEAALANRVTMLDYNQRHALQWCVSKQLDRSKELARSTDPFSLALAGRPFDFYRSAYLDFQRMKWLDLPGDLFPPDPPES